MKISLIVAMTEERVISKGNKLPWNIPEELQHFRATTKGCPVIYGRKTFESIGRTMPGRLNLILSRTLPESEKYVLCKDLDTAIEKARASGATKAFILGGVAVYEEVLERKLGDELILSLIKKPYDGDRFFPEFGGEWQEVQREEREEFTIITYERQQ